MRSATWDMFSEEDGTANPKHFEFMLYLAQGNVGLITSSAMTCNPKEVGPGRFGMFKEEHAEEWETVSESIAVRGNKLMFQINHHGLVEKGSGNQPDIIMVPTSFNKNQIEMTNADIENVIQEFVHAAKLTEKAGADAYQLHCAHGLALLSNFLSPALNRRTDKWGGSPENRARIVKEILTEVKKTMNKKLLLSIKFNGNDYLEGGITPETSVDVVKELINDVDLFEISCSANPNKGYAIRSNLSKNLLLKDTPQELHEQLLNHAKEYTEGIRFEEEYNRKAAECIKSKFPQAKIALVGGNRRFDAMESLVKKGIVDIVSMSRPLLKNPFLVREFQESKADQSDCCNCGSCILNTSNGVFCHLSPITLLEEKE